MKTNKLIFLGKIVLILACACSKVKQVEPVVNRVEKHKISNNLNYSSQYPYNLNVIYFVPNDRVVNEYYEERLSNIFIETQKYFNKWMVHWGYGDVTFGILKDEVKKRIKIHTIYGSKTSKDYSNKAQEMVDEIEHYFINNPNAKTSQHTMVIIPVNKKIDQVGGSEFTIPFRGKLRYGFAIDYPGFSLDNLVVDNNYTLLKSKYADRNMGRLRNEVGHALNLIPNRVSNTNFMDESEFGYPLMFHRGGSYFDLWSRPSYLTFFDATILAHCQLFSKQIRNFYIQSDIRFTSLNSSWGRDIIWGGENHEFILNGIFNATVPVTHVTLRVRSENDDIGNNSSTWTLLPAEVGKFSFKIPHDELLKYFNGSNYENASFEIIFHDIVGNIIIKTYTLSRMDLLNNLSLEIWTSKLKM